MVSNISKNRKSFSETELKTLKKIYKRWDTCLVTNSLFSARKKGIEHVISKSDSYELVSSKDLSKLNRLESLSDIQLIL